MNGSVLERACRTVKYHSTALRKCKIEHTPMCRSDWMVIDWTRWTRVSLMTVISASDTGLCLLWFSGLKGSVSSGELAPISAGCLGAEIADGRSCR